MMIDFTSEFIKMATRPQFSEKFPFIETINTFSVGYLSYSLQKQRDKKRILSLPSTFDFEMFKGKAIHTWVQINAEKRGMKTEVPVIFYFKYPFKNLPADHVFLVGSLDIYDPQENSMYEIKTATSSYSTISEYHKLETASLCYALQGGRCFAVRINSMGQVTQEEVSPDISVLVQRATELSAYIDSHTGEFKARIEKYGIATLDHLQDVSGFKLALHTQ